jgi:hypothetical protein
LYFWYSYATCFQLFFTFAIRDGALSERNEFYSMITKELKAQVLSLNSIDKIHLVETHLESLVKLDPEIWAIWMAESERRYAALQEGGNLGIDVG